MNLKVLIFPTISMVFTLGTKPFTKEEDAVSLNVYEVVRNKKEYNKFMESDASIRADVLNKYAVSDKLGLLQRGIVASWALHYPELLYFDGVSDDRTEALYTRLQDSGNIDSDIIYAYNNPIGLPILVADKQKHTIADINVADMDKQRLKEFFLTLHGFCINSHSNSGCATLIEENFCHWDVIGCPNKVPSSGDSQDSGRSPLDGDDADDGAAGASQAPRQNPLDGDDAAGGAAGASQASESNSLDGDDAAGGAAGASQASESNSLDGGESIKADVAKFSEGSEESSWELSDSNESVKSIGSTGS